jgi:hypothetical protein
MYDYLAGIFMHSVDKFEDDSEHQVCTIPFLQDKTGETSTSHTHLKNVDFLNFKK